MAAIGPDQQRLTPYDRDNLVAYLDGELNDAERAALQTKLTASATARREVETLEKVWELLEYLPKPKASDAFAERTFSEIRLIAERGTRMESKLKMLAARLASSLFWVLISLTVAGITYGIVVFAIPNPSERLSRELSIAEHLDEYRDILDKSFLDELLISTEFNSATSGELR